MDDLAPRLRAIADLTVATIREEGGRHEYDGRIADLSPEGVRAGLARLGAGEPQDDPHDEAHLAAVEQGLRYELGELELHRSNPGYHLEELDLCCYDKAYAPEAERRSAVERHLAAWPDAVDAAIASLDRVSAPVATALLPGARGLADGVPAGVPEKLRAGALAAHGRLIAHLEYAAAEGDPSAALGGAALARLMGTSEAAEVDLGRLAEQADAERDRLTALLAESAARIDPDRPALDVARTLVRDHPDSFGVLDAARAWTDYSIEFTRERDLVPYHDGECLVTTSPASRRWATAMLSWSGPAEPDGPTYYYVTPPDPAWEPREAAEWLEMFSATTLPGITVHEVAPGHFSHGRALRRAPGQVRRTLFSMSFAEGWAHYAEEMCLEEGFAAAAARRFPDGGLTAAHLEIGVWLEALIRVTRLASAIGVHTGALTVEEATRRFAADTHLTGPAARAEAERAAHDPTYGRYTWGKLVILGLRDQARARWGADFSLKRFHTAMLDLGSPPLGLLGTALERG
ncbi:DUF885 family protein [Marinactinospora rubrisoli]|uniref:DUF885 family protein n=1 Tax=Marinactinospora rubrisoli TaxID=2715399 RepID=A0ABW2KJ02_9ACTN